MNQPNRDLYRVEGIEALDGAENDARDWERFAIGRGYNAHPALVGATATTAALYEWIDAAVAAQPAAVLITWAGHGTQVRSLPEGSQLDLRNEPDQYDETWAMYDRMLLDDELCALLSRFSDKTAVVVVSDSCHSGAVFYWAEPGDWRARALPDEFANRSLEQNLHTYKKALAALNPIEQPQAGVVGLAACEGREVAYEANRRGRFTVALLSLLRHGFAGTYLELIAGVTAEMGPGQTPQPFWYRGDDTPLNKPAFTPR